MWPQVIKDNYGKWLYHDILEPGVMVHVSETGDKVWSLRCGRHPPDDHHAPREHLQAGR